MGKRWWRYLILFLVIFVGAQFLLAESSLDPNTPWDVLLANLMCSRTGGELTAQGAAACEQLSGTPLAVALGEIAGDAFFALAIVGAFWLINWWRRRGS